MLSKIMARDKLPGIPAVKIPSHDARDNKADSRVKAPLNLHCQRVGAVDEERLGAQGVSAAGRSETARKKHPSLARKGDETAPAQRSSACGWLTAFARAARRRRREDLRRAWEDER